MRTLAIATSALALAFGMSGPVAATNLPEDHKIEADIVAFDAASGTLLLSNGMVLDRSNFLHSAAVQRKVRNTEIRYIANDAKAKS